VLFAVIAGASLLQKELAKKTIYNILSKSVPRREFLLGKFFGISTISIVLVGGMGIGLLLYVACYEGKLSLPLVQALFYIILEGLIISAASIFFSSIVVTPLLIGLFTFFFFVVGRSASSMVDFAKLINSSAIQLCYWIVPHLDSLYAGNEAVFSILRSGQNMIYSLVYAVSYSFILLFLATFFFERRQFN
jgi:ABC-type transport system involved in multi-copper enzyme maturation permease subunit